MTATPAVAIVVTTVQQPTECMRTLAQFAQSRRLRWFVIGDRKGPGEFTLPPSEFFSIESQKKLPFRLARLLPEKHYARKNLGYLLAISHGHECIYETDDDNAPLANWSVRTSVAAVRRLTRRSDAKWANVYEAYTSEQIWPRGLPLDRTRSHLVDGFDLSSETESIQAPIQQGLANGAPDVDAVWRLVLDRHITFNEQPAVLLPAGVWCPFNSQNTWWWREVFPLLYLPSYCSFRMTDIWRSFVAQRCLWELGYELEFHSADVIQMRNEHSLLRDFEQETVGYLRNDEIRRILESCELSSGTANISANMMRCYEALVREEVIASPELELLAAWLEDCKCRMT